MARDKTPLAGYYGGKTGMVELLAAIIEASGCSSYVEAYAGGAAVFFSLDLRRFNHGVINEIIPCVSKFYDVAKRRPAELSRYSVDRAFQSRQLFNRAHEIVVGKAKAECELEEAWAIYYDIMIAYGGMIGESYSSVTKKPNGVNQVQRKIRVRANRLSKSLPKLGICDITCQDGVSIIIKYDAPGVVFYLDPPYIESDQGHYEGFGYKETIELFDTLSGIKGKFVLSSFMTKLLKNYIEENKWIYQSHIKPVTVSRGRGKRHKVEVIVRNFDIGEVLPQRINPDVLGGFAEDGALIL